MYNFDLFPLDFSVEKVPDALGEAPSEEAVAIDNVEISAKRVAIALSFAAKNLGITAIANQNRSLQTCNGRLPKEWVGSRVYPKTSVKGVKGIFAGGRYIPSGSAWYDVLTRFLYSTETPSAMGVRLRHPVSYQREGLCSLTDGYVAGGISGYGSLSNGFWYRGYGLIDKVNLASEAIQYLGELPGNIFGWYWYRHRYGMCANGNTSQGYWFGGGNQLGYLFNTAERIDYASDARSNLGIIFPKTFCWGQSCTNQTDSYILDAYSYGPGRSGNTQHWQYHRTRTGSQHLDDIYQFNYASETSNSLGTTMPKVANGGAAVEDADNEKAYVASGWNPEEGHGIKEIEAFDMVAQVPSSVGTLLSRTRHGASGIGSSTSAYFAGGYPTASQTNMDRFIFNGEVLVALGVNLNHYLYFTASIKDFHGGIA